MAIKRYTQKDLEDMLAKSDPDSIRHIELEIGILLFKGLGVTKNIARVKELLQKLDTMLHKKGA